MPNQPNLIRVNGEELRQKLQSKGDLLHMLAIEGQYHVPESNQCTMDFLREVIAGRKRLIKLSNLTPVNVPRIKEFCCETLYQAALDDAEARTFLPEPTPDGKRTCSRKFLFNGKYTSSVDVRLRDVPASFTSVANVV